MAETLTYTEMLNAAGVDKAYLADLFSDTAPQASKPVLSQEMEYRGGTIPVPARQLSQPLDPAYR